MLAVCVSSLSQNTATSTTCAGSSPPSATKCGKVLAGMGYRVWAVNQRGCGRTTRLTQVADYALPHLVDDVTALIDAATAKNVVLIGHDWGRWSLGALPPSNAARW